MASGRSGRRRASPLLKELRLWERRARRGILPSADLVAGWAVQVADAQTTESADGAELISRLGSIHQAIALVRPGEPATTDRDHDPVVSTSRPIGIGMAPGGELANVASFDANSPMTSNPPLLAMGEFEDFVHTIAARGSDFLASLIGLAGQTPTSGGYWFPDLPLAMETELQLDWVADEPDPWTHPEAIAHAREAADSLARQGIRVKLVRGRPVPPAQYRPAVAQPAAAFSLPGPHGPVILDQFDIVDQAMLTAQRPGLIQVVVPPARYRPVRSADRTEQTGVGGLPLPPAPSSTLLPSSPGGTVSAPGKGSETSSYAAPSPRPRLGEGAGGEGTWPRADNMATPQAGPPITPRLPLILGRRGQSETSAFAFSAPSLGSGREARDDGDASAFSFPDLVWESEGYNTNDLSSLSSFSPAPWEREPGSEGTQRRRDSQTGLGGQQSPIVGTRSARGGQPAISSRNVSERLGSSVLNSGSRGAARPEMEIGPIAGFAAHLATKLAPTVTSQRRRLPVTIHGQSTAVTDRSGFTSTSTELFSPPRQPLVGVAPLLPTLAGVTTAALVAEPSTASPAASRPPLPPLPPPAIMRALDLAPADAPSPVARIFGPPTQFTTIHGAETGRDQSEGHAAPVERVTPGRVANTARSRWLARPDRTMMASPGTSAWPPAAIPSYGEDSPPWSAANRWPPQPTDFLFPALAFDTFLPGEPVQGDIPASEADFLRTGGTERIRRRLRPSPTTLSIASRLAIPEPRGQSIGDALAFGPTLSLPLAREVDLDQRAHIGDPPSAFARGLIVQSSATAAFHASTLTRDGGIDGSLAAGDATSLPLAMAGDAGHPSVMSPRATVQPSLVLSHESRRSSPLLPPEFPSLERPSLSQRGRSAAPTALPELREPWLTRVRDGGESGVTPSLVPPPRGREAARGGSVLGMLFLSPGGEGFPWRRGSGGRQEVRRGVSPAPLHQPYLPWSGALLSAPSRESIQEGGYQRQFHALSYLSYLSSLPSLLPSRQEGEPTTGRADLWPADTFFAAKERESAAPRIGLSPSIPSPIGSNQEQTTLARLPLFLAPISAADRSESLEASGPDRNQAFGVGYRASVVPLSQLERVRGARQLRGAILPLGSGRIERPAEGATFAESPWLPSPPTPSLSARGRGIRTGRLAASADLLHFPRALKVPSGEEEGFPQRGGSEGRQQRVEEEAEGRGIPIPSLEMVLASGETPPADHSNLESTTAASDVFGLSASQRRFVNRLYRRSNVRQSSEFARPDSGSSLISQSQRRYRVIPSRGEESLAKDGDSSPRLGMTNRIPRPNQQTPRRVRVPGIGSRWESTTAVVDAFGLSTALGSVGAVREPSSTERGDHGLRGDWQSASPTMVFAAQAEASRSVRTGDTWPWHQPLSSPGNGNPPAAASGSATARNAIRLTGAVASPMTLGPALTFALADPTPEIESDLVADTPSELAEITSQGTRTMTESVPTRRRRSSRSGGVHRPRVAPERVQVVLDWVAGQNPWQQGSVPTIPTETARRLATQGIRLEIVRGREVPAELYHEHHFNPATPLSVGGPRGRVSLSDVSWLNDAATVAQRPGRVQVIWGRPDASPAPGQPISSPLARIQDAVRDAETTTRTGAASTLGFSWDLPSSLAVRSSSGASSGLAPARATPLNPLNPMNVMIFDVTRAERGDAPLRPSGPTVVDRASVGSAITRTSPGARSATASANRTSPTLPSLVFARESGPDVLPLRQRDVRRAPSDRPSVGPDQTNATTTTTTASDAATPQEAPKPPNLDLLARQVYAMIKQRLAVERERLGRPRGIRTW